MVEDTIEEKIERLASETVIKISNLVQSEATDKTLAAQKEFTKLRMAETRKMSKYFFKVYDIFRK
ncbi:MAG: hypothetical protein JW967_08330 [Dehalococcoidales bacterium]|nr:hypothetical protein [Dehalococcoidales bacterium]